MSYILKNASSKEIKIITDDVKVLIEEVNSELTKRMKEHEEEASRYAREKTLENHPILRKFLPTHA